MVKSFNQLKKDAMESKNKVGFLVDTFIALHNDALPEDFDKIGGRMGGILNKAGKDYLIVLQAIWKSSADPIIGSHLNYIQGIVQNKVGNVYSNKISGFEKILSENLIKRLNVSELRDKEKQESKTK